MASSLLSIAASGAHAMQAALDVTAQNIANASTAGYVRRSANLQESSSPNPSGQLGIPQQNGVLVNGVTRNADATLQAEVRRTGSDATRADTLVTGLTDVDNAVENSNVYSSITTYETSLTKLSANPTDTSLRANVLASATSMSQSFNVASSSLSSTMTDLQFNASSGVAQVNTLATNLASLNQQISSDSDPADNGATLLDQRDQILQQMSQYGNITTNIASNGTVQVSLGGTGGTGGQTLVSAGTATPLAMTTATNGTVSFTLGGSALTLSGGSLAGQQQALAAGATAQTSLDTIANSMMTAANTAQTSGVDLTGTAGVAMFSGTGAANRAVSMTQAAQVVTAGAGQPANSQDTTALGALQATLNAGTGPAAQMNQLYFNTSSAVASNTTTQNALDAISSSAQTQLANQSGVNLDTEAANLVQYQQAYQASGKVMQVAETLFAQLIAL